MLVLGDVISLFLNFPFIDEAERFQDKDMDRNIEISAITNIRTHLSFILVLDNVITQ